MAAVLLCTLGSSPILNADSYTFTGFDGPGGSGSTFLTGINDAGQLVGKSNGQGFLYSNGVFSTLPGQPSSINNNGAVVGNLPSGVSDGFIATPAASSVPEPSSFMLTALLLLVSGCFVRFLLFGRRSDHTFFNQS